MRRMTAGIVLTVLVVVPVVAFAQSMNQWVGTKWKLNVATSKYDPGPPFFTSLTTAYDMVNGVPRLTGDFVDPKGQKTHFAVLITFDGKDQPVTSTPTEGAPQALTWTHKWVDARTYEYVAKANGQVTGTSRVVISRDGKTATVTQKGTTPDGKPSNDVLIFDRQ